jgi:hypothetical protein
MSPVYPVTDVPDRSTLTPPPHASPFLCWLRRKFDLSPVHGARRDEQVITTEATAPVRSEYHRAAVM